MEFIPSRGRMVVKREDIEIVPRSKKPLPGGKKLVKKAFSMGDRNYVVLPPRVRAVPVSDLTIFGGSGGSRRFYKAEKETIPDFSGTLEDQYQSNGDNIVLRIGYKGVPEPTIQWFKGHEPLLPDPHSTKLVITADGAYSELAVFDAKRTDGGYYNCRIENPNGVRDIGCHVFITEGGPGGPGGSHRAYRSVLHSSIHVPSTRYSRF